MFRYVHRNTFSIIINLSIYYNNLEFNIEVIWIILNRKITGNRKKSEYAYCNIYLDLIYSHVLMLAKLKIS